MAPNRAGYQALSQSAEDVDDHADDPSREVDVSTGTEGVLPAPVTAGSSKARVSRQNAPKSIDLTKLDTAFKRWTESIAQKVNLKRKKKVEDASRKEILRSVFEPAMIDLPAPVGFIKTLDHKPPMTQAEWDSGIVNAVKFAISEGHHPKMITKGSSGSYFARAKVEEKFQTVGVFKPKDEEPYGRLNPKTTKWIHRQLRFIIPFGRACLIPNLSYISEAAASLLDQRLQLHIVPRTELVSLSSSAFFYDWIDRTAAKKGKMLPEKVGSMQLFMHGFTDASDFLRQHPWPGRAISETFDDDTHRTRTFAKRFLGPMKVVCGRTGEEDELFDEVEEESALFDASEPSAPRGFYWTESLQDSFREELEKLVILDYLMRNTDRGADNYMIKCCSDDHESSSFDSVPGTPLPPSSQHVAGVPKSEVRRDYSGTPQMDASKRATSTGGTGARKPHIHIAAIDNSLSFPHEHPKGWRSYTYGWLYLPVSIIGQPFSEKTRNHFLTILTDKKWWEETVFLLRKLFAIDPDFHPKMFGRQLALLKGQAYNIVESLKQPDEGPLELTRRPKVMVWDDEVTVTDENLQDVLNSPVISPAHHRAPSITSIPFLGGGRTRRHSVGAGDAVAPPLRRSSTEIRRPVPFSTKAKRVHPATTGVAVLEHMEQLDKVEAKLQRLGGDALEDDDEEADVGEAISRPLSIKLRDEARGTDSQSHAGPSSSPLMSPHSKALAPVQELVSVEEENAGNEEEVDEQDLAAMSKSTGQLDFSPSRLHERFASAQAMPTAFEFFAAEMPVKEKTVIVERMEPVDVKPFFTFC